jgi:hypothetical protein
MIRVAHNAHEEGTHAINRTDFVVRLAVDGDFLSRKWRWSKCERAVPQGILVCCFPSRSFQRDSWLSCDLSPCLHHSYGEQDRVAVHLQQSENKASEVGIHHINWEGCIAYFLFYARIAHSKNKRNSGSRQRLQGEMKKGTAKFPSSF